MLGDWSHQRGVGQVTPDAPFALNPTDKLLLDLSGIDQERFDDDEVARSGPTLRGVEAVRERIQEHWVSSDVAVGPMHQLNGPRR